MKDTCLPEKEFDFDFWVELARTNPEMFDRHRREFLENAVQRCTGDKQRLVGLQSRIDLERRRARVPLKTCIRLSGLMWDSFLELNEQLHVPHTPNMTASTATILPFTPLLSD